MTINNEQLKETFHQVVTIQTALSKDVSQVKLEKNNLYKFVPSYLAKIYSSQYKKATEFADSVTKAAYESSVVLLVATFERVIFAKYRTSYGALKNVVRDHSQRPLDYYLSREKFINTSIDKLAAIIDLFDGHIDAELMNKLKIIKEHRNYIAHGKRDSLPPAVEYSIEEIAKTLDDVILEIEK
jgi:hypothetical protein